MNKIEKQKKHFDSISEIYDKQRNNNVTKSYRFLLWKYFFIDLNKRLPSNNIEILDLMCGSGEFIEIFQKHCNLEFNYTGIDISKNMITLAKKKYQKHKFVCDDVSKLNLNDKKFDLIVLIGGLHHVYDQVDNILSQINKHMNKESIFINIEPTSDFILTEKIRDYIYKRNEIFDYETEKGFKLNELNKSYNLNNLDIVNQDYFGCLCYVLYYNPDAFPYLNKFGKYLLKPLFKLEKFFFKSFIFKKISFATFSILKRN